MGGCYINLQCVSLIGLKLIFYEPQIYNLKEKVSETACHGFKWASEPMRKVPVFRMTCNWLLEMIVTYNYYYICIQLLLEWAKYLLLAFNLTTTLGHKLRLRPLNKAEWRYGFPTREELEQEGDHVLRIQKVLDLICSITSSGYLSGIEVKVWQSWFGFLLIS